MLWLFGGIPSICVRVCVWVLNMFSGYYGLILLSVLFYFCLVRGPYIFSGFFFVVFLWFGLLTPFISLFVRRLFPGSISFLSSLLPPHTPLWVSPLVCVAEGISFIIRPFILMLRPFINIGLGCLGSVSLACVCLDNYVIVFTLVVIFLYELFVALVHWFIVSSVLSFSRSH